VSTNPKTRILLVQAERYDTTILGGGVAGLSAAVFTARHGLDTLVLDASESILRHNAHLENVPGFPASVNGQQLLDLLSERQTRAASRTNDS